MMRALIIAACLLAAVLTAGPALAASPDPGSAALDWAEASAAGHPYQWGGTGPYGFDCSGMVVAAFAHEGITLPRTTYAMLASPRLVRVRYPQRGDLAFYGSGHVELVTAWPDTTFGALEPGTRIGWHRWSQWWQPTAFYRVTAG